MSWSVIDRFLSSSWEALMQLFGLSYGEAIIIILSINVGNTEDFWVIHNDLALYFLD